MNFLWLTFAIAFVAVICLAGEFIVRSWHRNPPECVVPLYPVRPGSVDTLRPSVMRKRCARWISMNECEKLLYSGDNVVLITVRSSNNHEPAPFGRMNNLSVPPNQLIDVLQWLPPNACVVLDGELGLCCSIVEPLEGETGSASLYLLSRNNILSRVS